MFCLRLAVLMTILFGFVVTGAQEPAATGSLEVLARVRIGDKQEMLAHKRFYLIRGGLAENKALLDRIRSIEVTSRDCWYSRAKASPQFICWLQTGNCDTPFCREIEISDIERVPEFKTAYQKGLALFGRKTDIARMWLTTNMPPLLTLGYYREQRSLVEKILAGTKPIQSALTDAVSNKSLFVDIPLKSADEDASETFTVSNIRPIELGGKGYVWSCEVEILPDEKAEVRLQVPKDNKPIENCEVAVKDLAVCKSADCGDG